MTKFAVAFCSLIIGWVFSQPIIFWVGLLFLVTVLGYERAQFWKRDQEFRAIQQLLRRRPPEDGLTIDRLEALLWELESYRGTSSSSQNKEKKLPATTQEVCLEIADNGISSLGGLIPILQGELRGEYVGLLVRDYDDCLHSFFNVDPRALREVLENFEANLKRESSGKAVQVIDLSSDSFISRLPGWRGAKNLFVTSDEMFLPGDRNIRIVVLLAYREAQIPLPREREVLGEIIQNVGASLHEWDAVRSIQEKAKRSKRDQERYFAHVSHDIRTPLNNIQAILDLFFLEGLNGENRKFLQVARANCRSLRDIVEELLEFTKYREGKLVSHREVVSLDTVIREVIEEFQLTAQVKGVSLRAEVTGAIGSLVDRKQVKRILLNLVSNGIKYTDSGGVVVSLFERGDRADILVSDSGVGIPKEKIRELFVPFRRFGEVKVEGIGLGLTLTKILVESNGGTISCDSSYGEGSTFTVSFPSIAIEVAQLPSEEVMGISAAAPVAEVEEEVPVPKVRVLVVDDDVDLGRTFVRLLSHHGFEVYSVTRPSEVEEVMQFWKPDLLLSDVQIPEGGIQEVVRIANRYSKKVIAVTGSGDSHIGELLSSLGVTTMFRKPVDPEDLVRAICEFSPVAQSGKRDSAIGDFDD